ncbi:MAG TPA: restriction endonuclease [Rhizobacter sp.]|nr:restriction endonuclease [Rhizobacter sp.]
MTSARQQGILKRLADRLTGRSSAPEAVLPSGVALIEGMGWNQFELMAADGFRQRGYVVSETGGGGGRSVDMVLTRGQEHFLVDCKPWRSHAVGVGPVRELQGLMAARGAAGGFVLTSGIFTPEAVRFSEGRQIQLIDGDALRDLLFAREEKTLPVVVRREGPFLDTTLPHSAWRLRNQPCPLCGGPMVERVQAQGPLAGQRVLGCSHYPLCEGLRELPGPPP